MTGRVVVGVVVGCRHTGVVVRSAENVMVGYRLVSRSGWGPLPDDGYLDAVVGALDRAVWATWGAVVAVMDLRGPSRRVGNPGGAVGAGVVYGAVVAWLQGRGAEVVRVPRGTYGCRRAGYPPALEDADRSRALRAAWDVAGVGARMTASRRELAVG